MPRSLVQVRPNPLSTLLVLLVVSQTQYFLRPVLHLRPNPLSFPLTSLVVNHTQYFLRQVLHPRPNPSSNIAGMAREIAYFGKLIVPEKIAKLQFDPCG